MKISELIKKKRDGLEFTSTDIKKIVDAIVDNSISDEQLAALSMAIFINDLSLNEKVYMTQAMASSGQILKWHELDLNGPIVDKHSTGGVGDKVSIILVPLLASCGLFVPKTSGGALGHSGGTLDKMSSIPGYNPMPTIDKLQQTLRKVGCVMVGHSENIAPADQRLYKIRDHVQTVESISLITISIISKKISCDLDSLVLDVKYGNGAFFHDLNNAKELAKSLVDVANHAGLQSSAILTNMDQTLGYNIGNALEIIEAIEFLTNKNKDPRLEDIVINLASQLLLNTHLVENINEAHILLNKKLTDGSAAEKFAEMVTMLGGPPNLLTHYKNILPTANKQVPYYGTKKGYVSEINTCELGECLRLLNGLPKTKNDKLDYSTGFSHVKNIGDYVDAENPLLFIHANDHHDVKSLIHKLDKYFVITEDKPNIPPAVAEKFT